MAEKYKPDLTFLLRYQGKRESLKIELFKAGNWAGKIGMSWSVKQRRYRLRVDGKWYRRPDEKYSFFTKWEFRDLLWRSINFDR